MSQPSPRRFRPILRQHEYSSPTRTPTTTPHQHDLFSIDPSYGRPLSAKFSPRNHNSHHETYSREEYDRSAMEIQQNPLELPARFTRVFELEKTTTNRGQKRSTKVPKDEGIPQVVQRSPLSKAPLGFDALLEEDEDRGTSRAFYVRPNTPLPRVEFGDSEEENDGGSGSVMAPRLVAHRSGSSSEDSDGLISPPAAYIEDPLAQRFGYMTVKTEPNPFASGSSSPLDQKLNKTKPAGSKKTTSFGGQFRASQPAVAIPPPSTSSSSSLAHSRSPRGHSYSTHQPSGWQLSSFDDDDGCLGGF